MASLTASVKALVIRLRFVADTGACLSGAGGYTQSTNMEYADQVRKRSRSMLCRLRQRLCCFGVAAHVTIAALLVGPQDSNNYHGAILYHTHSQTRKGNSWNPSHSRIHSLTTFTHDRSETWLTDRPRLRTTTEPPELLAH